MPPRSSSTRSGIERDDLANYVFPKTWPSDREQRARIIGEWLQTEARFLASRAPSLLSAIIMEGLKLPEAAEVRRLLTRRPPRRATRRMICSEKRTGLPSHQIAAFFE
jgi:hypothetical protein